MMLNMDVKLQFTGQLRESNQTNSKGSVWEVSVIGEGPGLNSQVGDDGKLYREYFTRESVEDLSGKLNGVKVKSFKFHDSSGKERRDHLPPKVDESYNHRFIENTVGVLESPFTVEEKDKLHACAQLRLGEHNEAVYLRDTLLWAHEHGHPDFLGLSINSSGYTRQRIVEGTNERYLDVIKINRPRSVEVVDTPAAKGAIQAQFVRVIQSYQNQEEQTDSGKGDQEQMSQEEKIQDVTPLSEASNSDDSVQEPVETPNTEETPVDETTPETEDTEETKKSDDEEITGNETDTDKTTEEGSEETDVIESETDTISGRDLLHESIYKPLTLFLEQRDIVYEGENVRDIVESIDISGLQHLDQAALKQLRAYVKKNQVNAAKHLIGEMIRQMYRLESSLEYLNEYGALGILKQAQSLQNESTSDSILKQSNTSDDPVVIDEIDSNNGDITEETMATEEKITQEAPQEEVTPEEVTTEEEVASEEEVLQESAPAEETPVETKEDQPAEESTNPIDRLIESMSSFTSTQRTEVDELKDELRKLREQQAVNEEMKQAQSEMMGALSDFRKLQEQERMDSILRESGLLPEVVDEIREELNGKILSSDELKNVVDRKKRLLVAIQESSPGVKLGNVHGFGYSPLRMGANARDKIQISMHRLFENSAVSMKDDNDKNPAWDDPGNRFTSLRQGYSEITGDIDVSGSMNPRYIREGVIGHDTFEAALSNTMNRYLVQWYDTFEQSWRRLVRIRRGIRDFKSQEMIRLGGFGNLKVFEDTMQNPSPTGYNEMPPPIEEAGAFKPKIRGSVFTVTEVMIKNDDLFIITRLLEESARAADETLMTFVYSLLVGGSTYLSGHTDDLVPQAQINSDNIYGGARKLFAADNSGTTALDYTSLLDAVAHMKQMKKLGNGKPLRLYGKKILIVPLELEHTALRIHPTNTDKAPGGDDNDANILPRDLEIIAVDKIYLGNDPNNWYLIEDPMRWEGIQVGFVDDEENPRIVLANNPTAGRTFTHGGLQYTVTQRYGGGIPGHEGIYGSLVA